jgi:hypothetical protein
LVNDSRFSCAEFGRAAKVVSERKIEALEAKMAEFMSRKRKKMALNLNEKFADIDVIIGA